MLSTRRQGVLTVRELTTYIKELLDRDPVLQELVVAGEISNFTHHSSGHMYFSLKDDSSAVRAVMFRSANQRLKFTPEAGLKVLARGYVSVYERTGSYQLYVQDLQPDGLGALHLAFEQLKERLAAEGLFDDEHKRRLPFLPRRIGIVTSPTGAAVRDIINVSRRRYPNIELVVVPARVQGVGASEEIAAAIKRANEYGRFDVLIVGRGGGSLEDLWPFNEEVVARAIFESEVPVVSAVGHETDFTIADFVADLRAPTPSAAAELVVPDRQALADRARTARERLKKALLREAQLLRDRVNRVCSSRVFVRPQRVIQEQRQYTDDLARRLQSSLRERLLGARARWRVSAEKLNALSPLAVLTRGYSICRADNGATIRSSSAVAVGDMVDVWLAEGCLKCSVRDTDGSARLNMPRRCQDSGRTACDKQGV